MKILALKRVTYQDLVVQKFCNSSSGDDESKGLCFENKDFILVRKEPFIYWNGPANFVFIYFKLHYSIELIAMKEKIKEKIL